MDPSLWRQYKFQPWKSEPRSDLIVAGRVVTEDTNAPVPQAQISVAGRTESYVTEDNGNFSIRLDPGLGADATVRIRVQKRGFEPVDRTISSPATDVIIQMRSVP